VFSLRNLKELNALWDDFGGPVWVDKESVMWGSLTHLEILDISNCAFESQLFSKAIFAMTNLQQFYFGGNRFIGSFPKAECPPSLSVLMGQNNQLEGSFRWMVFDKVTSLCCPDMSNNLPTNLLPTTAMADAREESTNRNQYAATATLEYLDGFSNLLQLSLPQSIGQWTALASLLLSNNHLTGTLPATLGQLLQLQALDISHNRLQGPPCLHK
jgi:LRR receptor-like serine/threonine-protein kinase FLS2